MTDIKDVAIILGGLLLLVGTTYVSIHVILHIVFWMIDNLL